MLVLGLGACRTIEPKWDVPQGRAFSPQNFVHAGDLPESVRRVAVLPAYSDQWRAADIASIEEALMAELGKTERFEVVLVSRTALRAYTGSEAMLSSAVLPGDLMGRLRADFSADAILFTDLTHFAPYQPVAIGLRAKLVAVSDGSVLWSFDAVFDSAEPGVAVAARHYYLENNRAAPPLDDASSVLQSPARFARFVGYSTFGTLPKRKIGEK